MPSPVPVMQPQRTVYVPSQQPPVVVRVPTPVISTQPSTVLVKDVSLS